MTNTRTNDASKKRSIHSKGRKNTHSNDSKKTTKKVHTRRHEKKVEPVKGDNIRVVHLGGVEEVGKNMMFIEYGDEIVISDCGFNFVGEETPGVDYIIPNTKYLEENKDRIKGIFITHGHLDHIGGIPFIANRIGNPPIYAGRIATLLIKKRFAESPELKLPEMHDVKPGDKIKFKNLAVNFFEVYHSIPDAMGLSVETPHGNIVITGDLRLEHKEGNVAESEEKKWTKIGENKNLLLIADSTNIELPGFSIPEKTVVENLETVIKNIKGRIIVGTFASQFERMIEIIKIAEKYGKKIVTEGRSIKTNIEIAKIAGLLTPKNDTIIAPQDINKYPSDKILILATGAQGEEFAALMRMATKKHKFIQLNERDTVVLSSSIVPGNELSVRKLLDNLYRHDLTVITYKISDIHAGGHGRSEELKWINKKVNAKFFMPGYGNHSMLKIHANMAKSIGVPAENIVVPDNGSITEIHDKGEKIVVLKEKVPSNIVMVDGFSIGDIQEVVIRDRQTLAQDGIFVVIATLDVKTGKLRKSPDIISRGFVYLRESQELLQKARHLIKKTVEDDAKGMHPVDFEIIKKDITDNVGRLLLKSTDKRPIVIPVVLGV